jgi:hypothetical protein
MVYVNGVAFMASEMGSALNVSQIETTNDILLKRGDYVQVRGEFGIATQKYNNFQLTRLNK